jgi:hypothetical protein
MAKHPANPDLMPGPKRIDTCPGQSNLWLDSTLKFSIGPEACSRIFSNYLLNTVSRSSIIMIFIY